MRNIDEMAVKSATDENLFQVFAGEQKGFILNCAFRTTNRYVTTGDDEWSIALFAFSNAVKTYNLDKGSFLPYAELLIKRHLIDYYRSIKKYSPELTVNPIIFESNVGADDTDIGIKIEVAEKMIINQDDSLKYEIEAANAEFLEFGFSFFSLIECSPKSVKTKAACKQAIQYILENSLLMEEIYIKKQLPLKIIQKNTLLPRKLLEHHRKYIIAAITILSGEYPCLAEYLSFIKKEGN